MRRRGSSTSSRDAKKKTKTGKKKSKSDHQVVSAVLKAGLGVWRVFETAHPLGQKPEKMVSHGGQ